MKRIAAAFGIAILALLALVHLVWRASLPPLDGELATQNVTAPVSIERDALGIPTIAAANRADLAFGTGFVHGQDRFFQMDLSRRLAAGELVALFGSAAAEQDAKARVFEFRQVARRVIEQATPAQRAIVESYARGVNAGVASLRSRPWEYWLLRSRPAPWLAQDTILVVHAMWWDLQYADLHREILRRQIEARLGEDTCFLYPARSEWDAPNALGGAAAPAEWTDCAVSFPPPAPRGASRMRRAGVQGWTPWAFAEQGLRSEMGREGGIWRSVPTQSSAVGSNHWALAGRLTSTGRALVANDMHLNLRVPAIWYRTRLKTAALDLNGVTLPGAPVLVAGSNGHIAWGFSNSYGDWLDIDASGAVHWLAAVPEATNLRLMDFETATSVAQALALAPQIGIPHQNLIVGDRAGHIGWTIAGRIPLQSGPGRNDGSSPWRTFENQPRIVDPPLGRLWAANARATDDFEQELAIGGDEAVFAAGYDLGARARQIREDLIGLDHAAAPNDMLAVQLDDRAQFLIRWRELALGLLDDAALRDRPHRDEFKRLISAWGGRASADSVGYRLVREFRNRTETQVWSSVLLRLGITTPDAKPPARFEAPLWTLITSRPAWREVMLAQIDATIADCERLCGSLAQCTWGRRNTVSIRHPLSRALPFLAPLLDMPTVQLPGDHDMPRVQDGAFGASQRFAVSPGRESEGYLHIAGGQSGHPLSPYYLAGFHEWAAGRPLPFLPGAAAHRLTLRPR